MNQPLPVEPEFDLFISYVRRDVRIEVGGRSFDIVAQLKRELESHKRRDPATGKARRFRVCTDVDDFSLEGSFDDVMGRLIASSRLLLLVCTPGVPGSAHVQNELTIEARLGGRPEPLAAVLGLQPDLAAPPLFTKSDVAADLQAPPGASRRERRQLLRREAHKIVARVWGLPVREVFDRFQADVRSVRVRIAAAATGVLLLGVLLVIALAGELGMHRVHVLPIAGRLVAPAGVGFAADGNTPIVVKGDRMLLWSNGQDRTPIEQPLPFPSLRAAGILPGDLAIAGLTRATRIAVPGGKGTHAATVEGKIEAVAGTPQTLAVSTQSGDLLLVEANGSFSLAPRPTSVSGRRFSAFRETGPMKYGGNLAVRGERWVASASLDGRLAVLDRSRGRLLMAAEPQFELAPPIETGPDPILYETENTRPIGALAFLSDNELLFAEGAGLRRVDLSTGRITPLEHCAMELVRQLLVMPGRNEIIALTSSTIEVLRLPSDASAKLQCRQRTTLAPKSAPRAALAADGKTLLIAYFDGAPELWRCTFRLFGFDWPL